MGQTYRYVGPKNIAERVSLAPAGIPIDVPADVLRWLQQTAQKPDATGSVIATFVVDMTGTLRIADRRSEHVACAGGEAVLSAGEMTFTITAGQVSVTWVTNQSTGYCPEPESWPAVADALARAGIEAPERFSQELLFRRCERCGDINIIKDEVFECGGCSAELPAKWNFVDDKSSTQE